VFCLSVTAVDPTEGNLLFGGFVSRERGKGRPTSTWTSSTSSCGEVIRAIYNRP
jgi:hypothetical protein